MSNNKGTEVKVNKFENINVSFGTMNKNKPKKLYIRFTAWANPINKDSNINYDNVIKKLTKKIKTTLYRDINTIKFDKDKTLIDMDMRESGIAYGKPSYMCCEITLNQTNHHLLTSELMISELSVITDSLILNTFNDDDNFKFYKKKLTAKLDIKKPNHKD
jgi:hypothetical protein